MINQRFDFVERAAGVIGWPYKWGGHSPLTGFDCSGLVLWDFWAVQYWQYRQVLRFGIWRPTAEYLFKLFEKAMIPDSKIQPGCLAFWWNKSQAVKHVEIVEAYRTDGSVICVGARQSKGLVVQSPLYESRGGLELCGIADPFNLKPDYWKGRV